MKKKITVLRLCQTENIERADPGFDKFGGQEYWEVRSGGGVVNHLGCHIEAATSPPSG